MRHKTKQFILVILMLLMMAPRFVSGGVDMVSVMRSAPELDVLAWALYHEARGEGELGMAAVGRVIIIRANSARFPNSIRGVIFQDKQFSFITETDKLIMDDYESRKMAYQVASKLLSGEYRGLVNGADHYYAHDIVVPYWRRGMASCHRIIKHTFCKG